MPQLTRLIDHGAGRAASYAIPAAQSQPDAYQMELERIKDYGRGAARYGLPRIAPDAICQSHLDKRAAWLSGYDRERNDSISHPVTYAAQQVARQAATTSLDVAPDGSYGLNVARLAAIARGPR